MSAPGSVSSTSRTSKAIASSVARTMCARVVPRVMPMIIPRACGSQCGAPRPVSAGTNTTPSVSSTVAAMAAVSAALPTICRPSRSHCTADPVTKIAPSRAYVISPPGERHAAVESSPASLRTTEEPVLVRMNEPVP